jgi:hypothetical protein
MHRTTKLLLALGSLVLLGAAAYAYRQARKGPALPPSVPPVDAATLAAHYQEPLPAPSGPLRVYHLGHSLVGRDMPAMLAQLAGPGHGYESQLGWGASMREHWEPSIVLKGGEESNAHPRYRPAREAIASGDYDAVVLTESVEIKDAIRWHASPAYLARWAEAARGAPREGKPPVRVYLYETWHPLNDPGGFLPRIDNDLGQYWEGELLRGAAARPGGAPVYLIPAGQVMARAVRAAEAGQLPGVTAAKDFFHDNIHTNDLGAYLVALTHYAVLYHKSPEGLPADLQKADGTKATLLPTDGASALQRLVWEVVSADPRTGVRGR